VIACFFTGPDFPECYTPMLRQPLPRTGMPFDSTFPTIFSEVSKQNRAVHDGAVMVGRRRDLQPYLILGWSFRLFPKADLIGAVANRGSAFNSAHAMSCTPTVDAVYWLSNGEMYRFTDGERADIWLNLAPTILIWRIRGSRSAHASSMTRRAEKTFA
jgi:hypothetical protein